jgi:hypothetical protein
MCHHLVISDGVFNKEEDYSQKTTEDSEPKRPVKSEADQNGQPKATQKRNRRDQKGTRAGSLPLKRDERK